MEHVRAFAWAKMSCGRQGVEVLRELVDIVAPCIIMALSNDCVLDTTMLAESILLQPRYLHITSHPAEQGVDLDHLA